MNFSSHSTDRSRLRHLAVALATMAAVAAVSMEAAADGQPTDEQLAESSTKIATKTATEPAAATDGANSNRERFDRFGLEEPTMWSRAELAVGLTAHGGTTGVQTCMLIQCDSTAQVAAAATVGAATGMVGGLVWSNHYDVTHGRANAINSGGLWGSVIGLSTGVLANTSHPTAMGLTIAGRFIGGATGFALAQTVRPTAGDMALINFGALWSSAAYLLLTTGIFQFDMSPRAGVGSLLGVIAAGGSGGALMARYRPMSRTRTTLISAGGLVGAFAGLAVPALFLSGDAPTPALSTGALAGMMSGLAAAIVATADLDDPDQFRATGSITPVADSFGNTVPAASITGKF